MAYRRRFFGGRRRRRATWGYANQDLMQCSAGGGLTSYTWLLPPGRTNFLCDTDRVPHVGFAGCHMWLDFNWTVTGTGTPLPDVTFFVIVSQQQPASDTPTEVDNIPWGAPQLPSAITSWDEHEDDGTESFLWIHHIVGQSPPNAKVRIAGTPGDTVSTGNQWNIVAGDSDAPALVCRKFMVAAEWQPDVIIKSRRRVWKDEGVALVMRLDSTPIASLVANCQVRYRTLINRGR